MPRTLFVMQGVGSARGNAEVPDGDERPLILLQYAETLEAAKVAVQGALHAGGWESCRITRAATGDVIPPQHPTSPLGQALALALKTGSAIAVYNS